MRKWSKVKTHVMYKVCNHKLEQVKESKEKQALDWMREKWESFDETKGHNVRIKGTNSLDSRCIPYFEPWHYQEATIFFAQISHKCKKIIVENEYSITYSLIFREKNCQILEKKFENVFVHDFLYQLFYFLDRGVKIFPLFNVKSLLGYLHMTTQH
jgi:hypothetical protein